MLYTCYRIIFKRFRIAFYIFLLMDTRTLKPIGFFFMSCESRRDDRIGGEKKKPRKRPAPKCLSEKYRRPSSVARFKCVYTVWYYDEIFLISNTTAERNFIAKIETFFARIAFCNRTELLWRVISIVSQTTTVWYVRSARPRCPDNPRDSRTSAHPDRYPAENRLLNTRIPRNFLVVSKHNTYICYFLVLYG